MPAHPREIASTVVWRVLRFSRTGEGPCPSKFGFCPSTTVTGAFRNGDDDRRAALKERRSIGAI